MAESIVTALKHWMIHEALPFWSRQGFNPASGVFYERLHEDRSPDRAAPLRVRVQFRQIYTLCHADVLGWLPGGAQLALEAWSGITKLFYQRDGIPGFATVLAADGSVADARRDSYDHAFAMLALGWLARATGDAGIRRQLNEVLAFVDAHLTDGDGILLEGWPASLPRRQNPQMHWFEAMLGLHESVGHPEALDRAARYRAFFHSTLFDPATGTLGEYFTQDWRAADGAAGDSVEPGHQAEWTWLLRAHERIAGLPREPEASRLLDTAMACADPASGLLVDEVDRQLRVRRGTRRSWLQTELCKAWIAETEAGRPGARDEALKALAAMDRYHMRKPFAEGWTDQLDARLQPVPTPVPSSILYHVFVAVAEADRVLGQP